MIVAKMNSLSHRRAPRRSRHLEPATRFALTLALLVLGGCQSGAQAPPSERMSANEQTASDQGTSDAVIDVAGFGAWLNQIKQEAINRGVRAATVESAFAGISPVPRVIELDRRQPEFSQTFARYLNAAVTERRVRDGRAMLARHKALFDRLERRYGVPRRFLAAFWGLETNYGTQLGRYQVVAALSTLAYDGRRSAFFRQELFDALTIMDRGHANPGNMIGSWAGAMGQTQFMPSTFLKHAVDDSGDGRIDVWTNIADALGSGANYLKSLGWVSERTWGREVKLPSGFDAALASVDTTASDVIKPLAEWRAVGVRTADGGPLPQADVEAALVLPAGIAGPAFLVYENYRVILKWNRATFYALAVGHLADRLAGGGPLVAAMPPGEPLSRGEVTRLQTALVRLGHLGGEPDGVLGGASRAAVRAFQLAAGLPPDGYATRAVIEAAEAVALAR